MKVTQQGVIDLVVTWKGCLSPRAVFLNEPSFEASHCAGTMNATDMIKLKKPDEKREMILEYTNSLIDDRLEINFVPSTRNFSSSPIME